MKLTQEQKKKLIEQLSIPYGAVALRCDGYEIKLRVEAVKKLTYRVVTYVNGEWKGVWIDASRPCPEQKFLNKTERPFATPTQKAKAEKLFGKRAVAKDPFYTKKLVSYDISWPSGSRAINHLCNVCDSIEIVDEMA